MSAMLGVLGIDGADYRLATKWDCKNLLLENHSELESITHSLDIPATLEVWPTIATGKPPEEHGITLNQMGWDNTKGLSGIVRVAQLLPEPAHDKLTELKDLFSDDGYPQTDIPHMFNNGRVHNWPGITPCLPWIREGEWFEQATNGDLSNKEFTRQYFGSTGKCIGWLAGHSFSNTTIAGVHIHILDHMGHMYAQRPEKLKKIYKRVDSFIGWLRSRLDRLVIISDHGMQTTETDDPEPGVHSPHALISTTESGSLPRDVLSVRAWIENHTEQDSEQFVETSVDAPRDHLEDLGYL